MALPLVDLEACYEEHKKEIDEAIFAVLKSSSFIRGEQGKALEREAAAYIGVKEAVGVASGTDALILILEALGVGPGDEVIVPVFTFYATAEAVMRVRAKPVFCDIDPATGLISFPEVKKKISKRTKVLLPVHLFGQAADLHPLLELAKERKIFVVEDSAQAFGATYGLRKCGSFGEAAAVSFYPSKNLGACGDGGLVLTNNKKLAESVRLLANHGSRDKEKYLRVGYNSRLDEIQAAILRVKLPWLDRDNERRRELARLYREELARFLLPVYPLAEVSYGQPIYHLFAVRARHRKKLWHYLREKGILAQVHYPLPLHLHPVFRAYGYQRGDFPHAEKLAASILSLPLFPQMKKEQVQQVIQALLDFYQ